MEIADDTVGFHEVCVVAERTGGFLHVLDEVRAPEQEGPGGVELATLHLPITASSPHASRELISTVGDQWGIGTNTQDAARLAVSELVTNVWSHAGGTPGSTVTVVVSRLDDRLVVEVHDSSFKVPLPRTATEDDEDGRGLLLVEASTDSCGHYPTESGKAVWFEIKTDWPLDAVLSRPADAPGWCGTHPAFPAGDGDRT